MKPEYEKINFQPQNSFLLRTITREKRPELKGSWHYHKEFEICLTIRSKGKRFVGVNIESYTEGDLVLLGPELPHCWITNEPTEQIVIQFKSSFLGKDFLASTECKKIEKMLARASKGLHFMGLEIGSTVNKIIELRNLQGFESLLGLLTILNDLSKHENVRELSNLAVKSSADALVSQRIEMVYSYVLRNMKKKPCLDTVAEKLGMSKTTFCRFLKNKTGKTFSEIVNDIRIAHAARQLQYTDMHVQEVCYDSGFNDTSYFYRVFNDRFGIAPKQYKETFNK
ncbi:MAG: AraC family transcriptional regulator [Luteibaculaceae bacterium]